MSWVNYRAVAERFSHIDADFVSATASLSVDRRAFELVVRFYPWWEHPRYMAAMERGDSWGFSSYEAAKREVRVRAVEPWVVHVSPRTEVTEWEFHEDHPLLWSLFVEETIFVNAPFDASVLFNRLLALVPHASERDLRDHIYLPPVEGAPFAIRVAPQLYAPVVSVLTQLDVPIYSPDPPEPPRPAVVFLLDGEDYIIADDFEVDVPEFVHEDGWFRPVA